MQYLPTVPDDLAGIYAATGEGCVTDSDCDDLWPIPDGYENGEFVAYWECKNDTIIDTNTTDTGICLFMGCEDGGDCGNDELCRSINICDAETNQFYQSTEGLYSKLCLPTNICDNLKTPGNWTDDTMVCLLQSAISQRHYK